MFYKSWRTPPPSRYGISGLKEIRLCDTEKGLERIGRDLARSMKTKWVEYWPVLDTWCDLSSAEGLEKLENHLKRLYYEMTTTPKEEIEQENDNTNESSFPKSKHHLEPESCYLSQSSSSESSGGISQLCLDFENFHFSPSDNSTSPDMPHLLQPSCSPIHDDPFEPACFKTSDLHSSTPATGHQRNVDWKRDTKSTDLTIKKTLFNDAIGDCERKPKQKLKPAKYCKKLLENDKFSAIVVTVVRCLRDSLSEFAINFEYGREKGIRSLLKEEALPVITFLTELNFNAEPDLNLIHNDIAKEVLEEIKCSLPEHEMKLVFRYLRLYLGWNCNYGSSDEELQNSRNDLYLNYCRFKLADKIKWQHLKCILEFLCDYFYYRDSSDDRCCQCYWQQDESRHYFAASVCRQNISNLRRYEGAGDCIFASKSTFANCGEKSNAGDKEYIEDFVTPPSSPTYSSSDEAVTPDEGLEVYTLGSIPSKADVDMLRAVEIAPLDPVMYPHICRWKHLMECQDKKTIESWPSPLKLMPKRNASTTVSRSREESFTPPRPKTIDLSNSANLET